MTIHATYLPGPVLNAFIKCAKISSANKDQGKNKKTMDNQSIKAIVLSGGRATRLWPLTSKTPKSLVPVLNTPFLDHLLLSLKHFGITEVSLACGHLWQSLSDYYLGHELGMSISCVKEDIPLGTAGAVSNAWDGKAPTVLVMNGDIFSEVDIAGLIDFHRKNQSLLTFGLTAVEDPSQFGVIEIDQSGRVLSFSEKPTKTEARSNLINAGIYVVDSLVLSQINRGQAVSFEKEIFPTLISEGKPVFGFVGNGYWIDIGRPDDYQKLNFDLLNGLVKTYAPTPPGIYDCERQIIAAADVSPVFAKGSEFAVSVVGTGIGAAVVVGSVTGGGFPHS